jgi:hypothetical protein
VSNREQATRLDLAITGPVYYWLASRSQARRAAAAV